ncbi:MAG: cob(I)yrinic acid a,c-diamide adenosyltransferase [Chloroflexota bacterium]
MEEALLRTHRSSQQDRIGLVQIFTGEGKGKTTAALGTVVRSLGHGLKVHIVFFMKGDYDYGERNFFSHLPNVTLQGFGSPHFMDPSNIQPDDYEQAELALKASREVVLGGEYDLVVLDEVVLAAHWKLIGMDEVVKLIKDKPGNVEIILTGRYADTRLIELADLVTECRSIKHPFTKGISARPGIEY